ncbi:cell wall-binding repeat-containing protein [Sediminibacillus halophilus]|uniref:Putative cell wall-binding protein n=1 Tax=Sediminibacillus halophilus TaxID=482461 RepID=A0A1G9U402_9BACI|nr:cell wall-binding repeat-containing protein [Sediminibacillus halophilus]SDM54618.1 Putative cell wall-binding protein [Sediminibacillus halophilus]
MSKYYANKTSVKKAGCFVLSLLFLFITASQLTAAEEDGIPGGETYLEFEGGVTVEVNNDQTTSSIKVMRNANVLYSNKATLANVADVQLLTEGSNHYLLLEYRLDGTGQEVYFEVLSGVRDYQKVFTSPTYPRAAVEMEGSEITVSYPVFENDDIMTEPTQILDDTFKLEQGEVEKLGNDQRSTMPKSASRFAALASVEEKYQNPSYSEISRILTQEAINADIPPEIVKAIAYQESGWQQYWPAGKTPESHYSKNCPNWDGTNVKLGYDCIGIGIMQVSDYRFIEDPTEKQREINKLSTDIRYNIREGLKILQQKWNYANAGLIPKINDHDKYKLENWYFAILAYNGLSSRNNPQTNPASAYQEKIYQHIADYGLLEDLPPFPTYLLSPRIDGILRFDEETIHYKANPVTTRQDYSVNQPVYVTADSLTLRDSPSGSQIGSLKRGERVTITGSFQSSNSSTSQFVWYPVRTSSGKNGYVASSYLSSSQNLLTYALEGSRRYETSASIANYGWHWNNANGVVLGRGDLPIDALTGSVLAAKFDSPLLLTTRDTLQEVTLKEVDRLNPEHYVSGSKPYKIYLLGGTAAVSSKIENKLKSRYGNASVIRLSGATRYETAAIIAKETIQSNTTNEVYITTGDEKSSDALSIAAYAAEKQIPILLTEKERLSNQVSQFIKDNNIRKVTIIGGTDAVSTAVEKTLRQKVSIVQRVSGKTRFETSVAIAEKYYPKQAVSNAFFARGYGMADSLSGTALATRKQAPLLLTKEKEVPDALAGWLKGLPGDPVYYYLGGNSAISPSVRNELEGLFQ